MFVIQVNSLTINSPKWSNTLKQFIGNLPTNFLSVSDHFMGLAFKGLTNSFASYINCTSSQISKVIT